MIRRLLFAWSAHLPCRLINDGERRYLERYYLGSAFGCTVYLHRFVDSDPDRGLHDHPWPWALSLILSGWYWEQRRAGTRARRRLNWLTGDSFHRVVVPEDVPEVWTIFVHGSYVKTWGFLREIKAGDITGLLWTPHAYQANEKSGADRWWTRARRGENTDRMPLVP